ncbi:MAG: hypothetical protein AAF740_02610 [Bacteroidota bacterium]
MTLSARLAAWAMPLLLVAAFFGWTNYLPKATSDVSLDEDRLQTHFQRLAVPRYAGTQGEANTRDYLKTWLDTIGMAVETEKTVQVNDNQVRFSESIWVTMRGEDTTRSLVFQVPLSAFSQGHEASSAAPAAALLAAVETLIAERVKPETNLIFSWGDKKWSSSTAQKLIAWQGSGTRGKLITYGQSGEIPPSSPNLLNDGLFAQKSQKTDLRISPFGRQHVVGTVMDTPENYSLSTLYEQAAAMITAAKSDFMNQKYDDKIKISYFTIPIFGQLTYTDVQVQVIVFTFLGLLISLLILGLIRKAISFGSYFWSLLLIPVMIVTIAAGWDILRVLMLRLHPSVVWLAGSSLPYREFFVMAMTLLTVGSFWLLYGFFVRFLRPIELGAAALTLCGVVTLNVLFPTINPFSDKVTAFLGEGNAFESFSKVHFWLIPMFCGLLSWTYVLLRGRRVQNYNPADTLILTIFLLPAGIYLGEVWMGFSLASGTAFLTQTLMLCVWLSMFLPQWRVLAGGLRWTMPFLAITSGLVFLLYFNAMLSFTVNQKQPTSAFFGINLSQDRAFWASQDPDLEADYTRDIFKGKYELENELPQLFPQTEGKFTVRRDSMRYLPAPTIEKLADSLGAQDSMRYLSFRYVPSPRQAEEAWLYFPDSILLRSINLIDEGLQFDPETTTSLKLVGADTTTLQVIMPARMPFNIAVLEVKAGLGEIKNYTFKSRMMSEMPRRGILNDAVLLRKDFKLGRYIEPKK